MWLYFKDFSFISCNLYNFILLCALKIEKGYFYLYFAFVKF